MPPRRSSGRGRDTEGATTVLAHDTTSFPCVLGPRGGRFHRQILVNGKKPGAHRVAWEQASGQAVPEWGFIAHTCDQPPCTQNQGLTFYPLGSLLIPCYGHLFLTTNRGNTADKVAKGRQSRGERHAQAVAHFSGANARCAKLTWPRVFEIRRLKAEGATQASLARQFGVSSNTIFQIVHGRAWKDQHD
jgi:hypothetical protein